MAYTPVSPQVTSADCPKGSLIRVTFDNNTIPVSKDVRVKDWFADDQQVRLEVLNGDDFLPNWSGSDVWVFTCNLTLDRVYTDVDDIEQHTSQELNKMSLMFAHPDELKKDFFHHSEMIGKIAEQLGFVATVNLSVSQEVKS